MKVPDVLTSGDHKRIAEWREEESLRRTFLRRPDLLENYELSESQKKMLDQIEKTHRSDV
jgi:tRNA (guanine37-N1)-methyltransferase